MDPNTPSQLNQRKHSPNALINNSHQHPIVIFDGVCNFCNAGIQFILAHEQAAQRLRFAALQSETGQALMHHYHMDTLNPDSFLLIQNHRAYTQSDAALFIANELRGAWRLLTYLRWLPRGLRNWGYRRIARNRYWLFGRRQNCWLPTPELRSRFLDG